MNRKAYAILESLLLVRVTSTFAIVLIGSLCFAPPAAADIAEFCLGTRPANQIQQEFFDGHCPAVLQSLFTSTLAASAAAPETTQLSQDQTRAATNASVAGLVKEPASQVAQGADVGALAIVALTMDAKLTFQLGGAVASKIADSLTDSSMALIVSSASERARFFASPVDSVTVKTAIDVFKSQVEDAKCTGAPPIRTKEVLATLLAAEAIASVVATAANMFQPSLLATAKTTGVTDPFQLMISGLINGLGSTNTNKGMYVRLHAPAITTENSVLRSLRALRQAVIDADLRLAKCPKDPGNEIVVNAKAYIASLLHSVEGNPSLLDLAAQRAAIEDAKIRYTLLLQRDVSGGGAAAIKPNWFWSTQLMMATADLVTYELVDFEGKVEKSGYVAVHWTDKCGLGKWQRSFDGCASPTVSVIEAKP